LRKWTVTETWDSLNDYHTEVSDSTPGTWVAAEGHLFHCK